MMRPQSSAGKKPALPPMPPGAGKKHGPDIVIEVGIGKPKTAIKKGKR